MKRRSEPEAADSIDDYAAKYGHLDLFRDVDMVAVAHLLEACEEIGVHAGQTVLEEGGANDSIYVILDGSLEVRLGSTDSAPLVTLGIGDCAGELSILNRLSVSALVLAPQASRLLVIRDELMWSLIGNSHEFACNLLKILSGRVREDNHRLQISLNAQEHFARASRVDALTGLYNRRWLDEILARQCRRCESDGTALSLILIDIDHFKRINDRCGHLVGDDALKTVAGYLRQSTRPIDLAARFGGEEFAILLYGIGIAEAADIGERIRLDIEQADILASFGDMTLTVSLGIAELDGCENPQELLQRADRALYDAKDQGRNCAVTAPGLAQADFV